MARGDVAVVEGGEDLGLAAEASETLDVARDVAGTLMATCRSRPIGVPYGWILMAGSPSR